MTHVTIILATLLLLLGGAAAQPTESDSMPEPSRTNIQSVNLRTAFLVGQEVGNPETLQAILMQESNGGLAGNVGNLSSPIGKRSYGVMQVQLSAARSVLTRTPQLMNTYFPTREYKSLADEEIIALLITNAEANIRIAAHHLKIYMAISKGDWNKAVAAYNVGIGGVERIPEPAEYHYVINIKQIINNMVKPFNHKHQLRLSTSM